MKFRLKIGTRILAGYCVALGVFAIVGVITYRGTMELRASSGWVTHTYKVKEAVNGILSSLKDAETGERGYLITLEDRFLEPYRAAIGEVGRYVEEARRLTRDNPNQARRLDMLQPLVERKLGDLAEAIRLRPGQRTEESNTAILLMDRSKSEMDQIRRLVAEMQEEEEGLLARRTEHANDTAQFLTLAIVIGFITAGVLVLVVSVVIQRSITGPLSLFTEFARRVGEGDLTQKSAFHREDELGELATHLDEMVVGLRELTRQTSIVAESLNEATTEILASTQQQSAATVEQTAAIQQASATMSELSQTGSQITDRAKQVSAAAEAVSTSGVAGLRSVQETNSTMGSIREQAEAVAENVIALSEKTQAISAIIASVNDIAEQSHLLALNAGIQAAAAGEHGRAFSVVAAEMKNLAAQSKQATVQVRSILGDIQKGITASVMLTEEAVKRTDSGQQQAGIADKTIRQLADNLDQSIRAFQQIAAGSNQQQIGFDQLTQTFRSIGIASQQTAASTRQSEKAAANLSALSQQLRAVINRYRL